ncbi:tRNA pseudouridine(55) synthase TruB [Candidatus Providencia siddallii]|uniref:tRNA pseudouridine synthase B n=1 Tax=Candidatus Providencia siddallii TaxID=1715285 RepID=A0ABP1CFT7_9GAMM
MKNSKKRNINGTILLDKPICISSNKALQKIKQLFNAKKAGHTGTLDPIATGMLPICFGEATKFSQFLLNSNKEYIVIAKLGQRTDTSDSYGKIINERKVNFIKEDLYSALNSFKGKTFQIPPMYSALKYKGKPMYKYAKKGIIINRSPRLITINKIKYIRLENNELELEIHCLKGTYIRTIIDDLGELLGCGAHVIYLRRTKIYNYQNNQMIKIEKLISLKTQINEGNGSYESLLDTLLLPIDSGITHLPVIKLNKNNEKRFIYGQCIYTRFKNSYAEQIIRVLNKDQNFLGIALINKNGDIFPKRLVNYYKQ